MNIRQYFFGCILFGLFSFCTCTPPVPSVETLVVSNEDGHSLSFFQSHLLKDVHTMPVGKRPRGLKIAGKYLYVALSGSPKCPPWVDSRLCEAQKADKSADGIAEIDIKTRRIVRILPAGSDPEQFDVSPDGKYLYIANEDAAQLAVLDLAQAKILYTIQVGDEPEGVRCMPDGRKVFVSCEKKGLLYIVDVALRKVDTFLEVGMRPRDIILNRQASLAFISSEAEAKITILEIPSYHILQSIRLPPGSMPVGMVLDTHEQYLYVANGRAKSVLQISLKDYSLKASVEVKNRPWNLYLSADNSRLYSANGSSDDVSVIDTKSFMVIDSVRVGKGAWGVVGYKEPK